MHEELWKSALSSLEGRIKPHNFEMWLRPIRCKAIENQCITLVAPSRWIQEWFQDHYQSIVMEELGRQGVIAEQVIFELDEAAAVVAEEVRLVGNVPGQIMPESISAPQIESSPKHTFDTFVVGPSNQLAHAASRAVAEQPATKYNPLFIYGGVGLGKTHLVQAIYQRLKETHPEWRIFCVKTEAFLNEYIACVRNGRIDDFRNKYRKKCDALLMDDIQFLAGKDRTQEEFFHTFNSLFESHKQIVLTADKYPHEIPDLEDRLRSRFQNGLIADIQAPELETRIAILKKKADLDGIELPDDVANYLATHIKSNVRELEGLLLRVAAFADLQHQSITVEFAQNTLRDFFLPSHQAISIETVQKEVAHYFNVRIQDMKSQRRNQAIAWPRQIAMYLARKLCKASYPELGSKFGGKDHTTVLSACRKIEKLMATDAKTRHTVEELERHFA